MWKAELGEMNDENPWIFFKSSICRTLTGTESKLPPILQCKQFHSGQSTAGVSLAMQRVPAPWFIHLSLREVDNWGRAPMLASLMERRACRDSPSSWSWPLWIKAASFHTKHTRTTQCTTAHRAPMLPPLQARCQGLFPSAQPLHFPFVKGRTWTWAQPPKHFCSVLLVSVVYQLPNLPYKSTWFKTRKKQPPACWLLCSLAYRNARNTYFAETDISGRAGGLVRWTPAPFLKQEGLYLVYKEKDEQCKDTVICKPIYTSPRH